MDGSSIPVPVIIVTIVIVIFIDIGVEGAVVDSLAAQGVELVADVHAHPPDLLVDVVQLLLVLQVPVGGQGRTPAYLLLNVQDLYHDLLVLGFYLETSLSHLTQVALLQLVDFLDLGAVLNLRGQVLLVQGHDLGDTVGEVRGLQVPAKFLDLVLYPV